MKQTEIARYLKAITLGITGMFLIFVFFFLPLLLGAAMDGEKVWYWWGTCGFLWVTAIPCLLCLWRFWQICGRIGADRSFSQENAEALKQMSHYMLIDSILYGAALLGTCWILKVWAIFLLLLIVVVCVALTVVCAALSHLVYKASELQEDQDLTI